MKVTVGRPINIGDVISKSTGIVRKTPVIMVPQLITLVPTLISDLLKGSALNPIGLVLTIASALLGVIVAGAYPSMVKTSLDGGTISVSDSLRQAYHRFAALFVASIFVGLLIVAGLIALVVPGIILTTWYIYTVPAMMFENKGAREAMAASKAFGRDKKGATFTILVVVAVVYVTAALIEAVFGLASPLLGEVIGLIIGVPLGAWVATITTYTYLTYGPSSVTETTQAPEIITPGQISPEMRALLQEPSPMPLEAPAQTTSGRFCGSCGAPVKADSKFCASCGKPL